MRYKSRKIRLSLGLVVFLAGCSKSLINFQPMDMVDELCFVLHEPSLEDFTLKSFYSVDNKSDFEEITEKYNISKYCSTLEMFDDTFFSNYLMFMFFYKTSGNKIIGSEITDNLVIYHIYYPEAIDDVILNYCFTTIVEKESLYSNYDDFEYTTTSQMVSDDEFNSLENNESFFYIK